MGIAVGSSFVSVQHCGNRAEHLKDERLPVHQIKLFYRVFYCCCNQAVGLVVGVDL